MSKQSTWAEFVAVLEQLGGDISVYNRETIEYWLSRGVSVPWILTEILGYDATTIPQLKGKRVDQ